MTAMAAAEIQNFMGSLNGQQTADQIHFTSRDRRIAVIKQGFPPIRIHGYAHGTPNIRFSNPLRNFAKFNFILGVSPWVQE
jgi:hypothetical protein